MFQPTSRQYSVYYYVNGERTGTFENVSAEEAYKEAIPGEALLPFEGNRWHVMLRWAAYERMLKLKEGDELAVAWQDPGRPGYDTERIVIALCPPL